MKRIISILLSLCLVLSFAACSNKESADVDSSSSIESEASTAAIPENYVTVLTVSINPVFKLYLDISGNVLSVEAANEDAKSIQSEITFKNEGFEAVISKIVESANKNGFIKDDAKVDLTISESKNAELDLGQLLIKAEASVVSTADSLEVKVTVTCENKTESAESSSDEATKDDISSNKASSDDVSSNKASSDDASSANVSSSVTSSKNSLVSSHSHSFSAATCTDAEKCACGATGKKALGHSYIHGTCKRCGQTDPDFKFDPISSGYWIGDTINGDKLSQLALFFEDAPYYTYSFATVATEAEINSGEPL